MDAFLKSLAEDHEQNGIDVLVNNAGISIGGAPCMCLYRLLSLPSIPVSIHHYSTPTQHG